MNEGRSPPWPSVSLGLVDAMRDETETAAESQPDDIAVLRTSADGAIVVITLDGPGALSRLEVVLSGTRRLSAAQDQPVHDGRLLLGRLTGVDGEPIDEVLVAVRGPDESETGFPQAEFNTHGGPVAATVAFERLQAAGFRAASEQELCRRSLARGRLNLVALEERLVLSRCVTPRQVAAVSGQAGRWLNLLGELESAWDGSSQAAAHWQGALAKLARGGEALARLLRAHTVAVIGPANAGKSTLVNRLARENRVLVSDVPGTTRDLVEVPAQIGGLDVTLVDTAGERTASDPLEASGQTRARDARVAADLLLIVIDGSRPPAPDTIAWLKQLADTRRVIVLNKSDVGVNDEAMETVRRHAPDEGRPVISASALSGAGMNSLTARLVRELLGGPAPLANGNKNKNKNENGNGNGNENGVAPFTARQRRWVRRVAECLEETKPRVADPRRAIAELLGCGDSSQSAKELAQIMQEQQPHGQTL